MPTVTQQRAQQLFDLVNAKHCCPVSAAAPCMPFLYPDDGCWGRAHQMCRLMIADGAQPQKVWIKGSLRPSSRNHPGCGWPGWSGWGWHVAPTLEVNTVNGVKTWVIDPALFNGPIPQATWKGVQGDPNAVLKPSAASMFYYGSFINNSADQTDPLYVETNNVLARYRNLLRLRSVSPSGPPPYFACMTKPPGTQWFGTIAGNATRRWFTWGWPAKRHVFWTVMSLTPCPGKPQLTWSVQVERANAAQCTYWITVRNLTADAIRFEGRYDVLSW